MSSLYERKRLELMNDCHLSFDQANKVMKKIKEWKLRTKTTLTLSEDCEH